MAETEDKTTPPATPETPAKPSMLPKLMIGGFVGLVVIVETCVFFFMVPSADDVARLAEMRLISKVEASMIGDGEETLDDDNGTMEFPLGEYSQRFTPPGSERNYFVEFQLVGTIYEKDQDMMEALYERKSARFQHRIMLEIRNATTDELMETELGLIQRRILATSNEVLEEGEKKGDVPALLGVSFPTPGFQVYEE